jgi:hypothetical protein
MPGPLPKETRRRRNKPASGEWKTAKALGWQFGAVPEPPDGLLMVSKTTWTRWFTGWWAAFWVPEDLSGLETVIMLFDATRRGELQRSAELRMSMDAWGLTPHGRQMLHWQPPKKEEAAPTAEAPQSGLYSHLRVVNS